MNNIVVRETKKEEFYKVIELINKVFRKSRNLPPTMMEEFPLLLNVDNCDNMRCIWEDNKPVCDINFLKETIFIEGAAITAASIGAVCTDEDYRRRGYASIVLDDVEEKMYRDGIDLVLISGQRSLYQRRGCTKIMSFNEYTIKPKVEKLDFVIKELHEEHMEQIISMYNKNSTRYFRTYNEFKVLMNSATFPWGDRSYKKYVLDKASDLVGYIILRIDNKLKEAEVVECFGSPEQISKSLSNLAHELNLNSINYYVHIKDKNNQLYQYYEKKLDFMEGTIKIINFESLMLKLNPYFSQYVDSEILNNIQFSMKDGNYQFSLFDEKVIIKDIRDLNKLIFQGIEAVDLNLKNKLKLKGFLTKVFPVPFVWPRNLNYQ